MVKNNSSVHQQMYVCKLAYTYNGVLVSLKKEGNSLFYCTMVNHENIRLSERNPASKHKCHTILHIWVA